MVTCYKGDASSSCYDLAHCEEDPMSSPSSADPVQIQARHFAGLFLLSLATLLLELALTRILSVSLWYHFGFLVISTALLDRKSTRLNSSHPSISYAVFCLKKKKKNIILHGNN